MPTSTSRSGPSSSQGNPHNLESVKSLRFASASVPSSRKSSLGPRLPAPPEKTSCERDASIISNEPNEDEADDPVGEETSEAVRGIDSVSRGGGIGWSGLAFFGGVVEERRGRSECFAINVAMQSKYFGWTQVSS